MRLIDTGASLALALALAATLAGCGASQDVPREAATLAAAQAVPEVNSETGQIVLPVDRFFITPEEQATLASALALGMSTCATAKGVDTPYQPLQAAVGSNRLYGVWSQDEAERYGYGLPDGTDPAAVADDGELTEEDLEVYIECNDSAELAALRYDQIRPAFSYSDVFADTSDRAFSSAEGQAAFEDWESCLNEQGISRDPAVSPFMIRGTTMEPSESNIRIALIDVGCKQETQFVERLAAAEAEIQVPIIERYLPELLQMREEYDDALGRAESYLAENS